MSALGAGPSVRRGGPLGWWLPTGRIRCSDWWLRYFLVFVLLGVLATVLDGQYYPESLVWERDRNFDLLVPLPNGTGPISSVTATVLFITNIAALVTRLHDRDHSAWWLLWVFVPLVGAVVLFVTVAVLGTDPRPNRYGPPPA